MNKVVRFIIMLIGIGLLITACGGGSSTPCLSINRLNAAAIERVGQIDPRTERVAACHDAVLVVADAETSRKVLERLHLVLNIEACLPSCFSPSEIKRVHFDAVLSWIETEVLAQPPQCQVQSRFYGMTRIDEERIIALEPG